MRRLIAAAPRSRALRFIVIGSLVSAMPTAHAAIMLYYSNATTVAYATAYGSAPQEDRDDQQNFTVYSELVSASNGGSYEYYDGSCDCNRVLTYSSAGLADLSASADVASGVFNASGYYVAGATGQTGYANAGGGTYVQFMFDIDQPYSYQLQVNANSIGATQLTDFSFQFGGDFANPADALYVSGPMSQYDVYQTGVLVPNTYYPGGRNYIYLGMGGCEIGCSGGTQGAFNYTLTLTPLAAPVPLPAAAWLLLSGLTGFGFVARRRTAA